MKNKKQNYDCWFLINQHQEHKEFETIEKKASSTFLNFIKDKDYGKGIGLFRFDIYVQSPVNFGHQTDSVYTECAHLSIHIDKSTFYNSPEKEKLLLNAALVLIKYLAKKVPLPKGFQADTLVADSESYLASNSFLLSEEVINKVFVKFFETTRFNFRRTETIEVKRRNVHIDLNEIEDYINNQIAGKSFGSSVNTIDFGFELYDFNGEFASILKNTENYKRYGTRYKNYLVVKHFDYSKLKSLDSQAILSA